MSKPSTLPIGDVTPSQCQQTIFRTETLRAADIPGQGRVVALIGAKRHAPMRVIVRNIGGALDGSVGLSDVEGDVTAGNAGINLFILPPGASETLVLASNQRLFAAAITNDARVSIACSAALPIGQVDGAIIYG